MFTSLLTTWNMKHEMEYNAEPCHVHIIANYMKHEMEYNAEPCHVHIIANCMHLQQHHTDRIEWLLCHLRIAAVEHYGNSWPVGVFGYIPRKHSYAFQTLRCFCFRKGDRGGRPLLGFQSLLHSLSMGYMAFPTQPQPRSVIELQVRQTWFNF